MRVRDLRVLTTRRGMLGNWNRPVFVQQVPGIVDILSGFVWYNCGHVQQVVYNWWCTRRCWYTKWYTVLVNVVFQTLERLSGVLLFIAQMLSCHRPNTQIPCPCPG